MNELKRPQSRAMLPIISVVTFLGFLDTHLLIPVMALYASTLGASVGTIGFIIGLYSITNTPANILLGRLIDRLTGSSGIGASAPRSKWWASRPGYYVSYC